MPTPASKQRMLPKTSEQTAMFFFLVKSLIIFLTSPPFRHVGPRLFTFPFLPVFQDRFLPPQQSLSHIASVKAQGFAVVLERKRIRTVVASNPFGGIEMHRLFAFARSLNVILEANHGVL